MSWGACEGVGRWGCSFHPTGVWKRSSWVAPRGPYPVPATAGRGGVVKGCGPVCMVQSWPVAGGRLCCSSFLHGPPIVLPEPSSVSLSPVLPRPLCAGCPSSRFPRRGTADPRSPLMAGTRRACDRPRRVGLVRPRRRCASAVAVPARLRQAAPPPLVRRRPLEPHGEGLYSRTMPACSGRAHEGFSMARRPRVGGFFPHSWRTHARHSFSPS